MSAACGEERACAFMETESGGDLEPGHPLVFFQPIVAAGGGRPVAAEALLRWRGTGHDLLVPAEFLPALERDGRIVELGAWVLDHACRQASRWRTSAPGFRVMVNVATRQLVRAGLVELVGQALDEHGLPGSALEIEIGEHFPGWSWPGTLRLLDGLRELGVRVAVDDFGAGYSSIARLRRLPLDTLKLDRSLLADDDDGGGWRGAAFAATVAAGRRLGLRLIAEGVETETQAERAAELGCEELQGYLYGRPMPADDLDRLLDAAGAEALIDQPERNSGRGRWRK